MRRCMQDKCAYNKVQGCQRCEECNSPANWVDNKCKRCKKCEGKQGEIRWCSDDKSIGISNITKKKKKEIVVEC